MIQIRTLLIANRGEIALRVMRTAARLGIRTVAVFTEPDAHALHVRAADDSVQVPSYLDVEAIVATAVATGAQAVHPGYGFLSERAPFARALEAAGVRLVGPSADVIDLMGRKDAAREVAERAGVPVVPSYDPEADPTTFTFPVLVKAAAGGGGKGMRVVREAGEYAEAIAAARREAAKAFGDDAMLVERYVERGRHVEVQVVGDDHGGVVHLFERDCSAQRRHQKVLEEAPAPGITAELRHRITSAAVDLAREVGYSGAGTVEFLLDTQSDDFYFLEMNTRLQVEHPVTEAICGGVDLVEEQLRVAEGHPLSLEQGDLVIHGHAIEARVYAEDPYAGFLPQAGTASLVRWPGGAGVRVDHALESGQVVSTSFDPMLGKVVVHGPDREAARLALVDALDRTSVLGLTTNTGFLRALAASDAFRDVGAPGGLDTAWLDRVDIPAELPAPTDEVPRVLAAWTAAMVRSLDGRGTAYVADGFRLGADPAATTVELDRPVVVHRRPDDTGTVDGVEVRQLSAADHVLDLVVDGTRVRAVVDARLGLDGRGVVEVAHRGQLFRFTPPDRLAGHADDHDGDLLAPMPGTVLDVRVEAGQQVQEGQVLGVLEAMKMELAMKAPYPGTVTVVDAAVGRQVPLGHVLFHVEQAGQEGTA